MVVWNRPRGIRSQGCCFVSPRWGKSKKRVLNGIGRRSLFALLGKAHSKWWYETDLLEFDPKGVFSFRPDGESRKNSSWAKLDDVRQPGFLPCLERPTQNGGMKPTSWNSIPRVFFRFASKGKVEKTRFERNWTTFVNPAFCTAWKSPLKMVVWNRPLGIRSQGCFFFSPRWGKSKKRVLSAVGRRSSTRLLALLGIAHSKWWYETDLVEFDPKGVFSFRPDGESRKSASWTQLDDVRQPGFLPCLEKPTQNSGMKPTSWNSIPRVLFRFAPMGKVEKTRFERNWTTFVNPAFCPAWKSPLKMVVWNRPGGNRSQGCFFLSPRWRKSKKTRFEHNWMTFLNPAFCPASKSPLKMVVWNRPGGNRSQGCFFVSPRWEKSKKTRFERNWMTFLNPAFCPASKSPLKMVVWNRRSAIRSQWCFFVSPRRGKSKKRVLNGIGRRSSTRLFALLGKAHSKWWYETDLVEFDPKGVFSFRLEGESRKNAFWTQLDDVRQPGFLHCLEKPTQNGGMKPTSWNSIPRVFFLFAPMGKVEKTRLERSWTTFVNPAFSPAWNSPLKMVVWNRPRGIRSQGCFFVSPRWGKSKKRVLHAIGRRSSTRLFALLGKAHSKWWYETDLVEFDPKGVVSFCPDGESRKNAFWTQLDDVRQPGFLPCLEKPTQNGGMKPTWWKSIPRVFFPFAPMGKLEKNAFWTQLDDVPQPGFLPCFEKPTQNGGMKPT